MSNQSKAYIFAISAVLLWSTIASAFKIALSFLDYIHLLFFASIFSSISLFIILFIQGKLISAFVTIGIFKSISILPGIIKSIYIT
jgi:hypothetical protein